MEMRYEISLETLVECFAYLPDPRIDRRKRHKRIDIVVIGLCAVICGAEGHADMETFGETKAAAPDGKTLRSLHEGGKRTWLDRDAPLLASHGPGLSGRI